MLLPKLIESQIYYIINGLNSTARKWEENSQVRGLAEVHFGAFSETLGYLVFQSTWSDY